MSYQIIPTIIFLLAIFFAVLMVLRRLPEAENQTQADKNTQARSTNQKLSEKGLPTQSFSIIKHHSVFWAKKIWRFILEAKEIAPSGTAVLKIKKLFLARLKSNGQPLSEETHTESVHNKEEYFLEAIKKDPKNFIHYDALGKFYLRSGKISDAKDIYLYLTSHASGIADYWAYLGFSSFRLKNYAQAAEAYKKSIALDSAQPNRYYNLAQCYKAAGKPKEALEAINNALSMDPQNFKFLEFKSRMEKQ